MSSSRKKLFIILGIALLVILVFLYLIIMASPRSAGPDGPRGIGNIFPFGDREVITDDEDGIIVIDDGRDDEVVETVRADRSPVFRVTNRPVTAHNVFTENFEIEVERQDEDGEVFTETIPASETSVIFTDTRTGEGVRVNVDADVLEDDVLTQSTVSLAHDGYIAGDRGELIVLRFLSPTSGTVETYLGERDIREAPLRICREVIRDSLTVGDTGPQVSQLQEILRYRGHYDGTISGTFTEETRQSLELYQSSFNLPSSGEVGSLTRDLITQDCQAIETELQQLRRDPRPVRGSVIRSNVYSLSLSPDRSTIFYTVRTNQGSRGFLMNLEERREVEVFTSPFSQWLGSWSSNDTIALHTAASGLVRGFAYTLDVNTREFRRLIGDRTGLVPLQNPSGTHTLVSEGGRGAANLIIHRREDNTIANINLATFAEKCAWHNDRYAYCAVPRNIDNSHVYPDAWYRGTFIGGDGIWRIDAETGQADLLVDAIAFDDSLDAVDLHISDEENYLFVRNRATNTLWGVDLEYFLAQ